MSETQLSFFDESAAHEYRRKQRNIELDALLIQYIGEEEAKRWHAKKNKRAAKLAAILSQPLRPDLQAAVDELRAKVIATAKPYLANEYTLLGVQPGATKRDIKNAYRRQARKLHPDKGGDAQAFRQMHDAYWRLLASVKE